MHRAEIHKWLFDGPLVGIGGLCSIVMEFAREFEGRLKTRLTGAERCRSIIELPDDRIALSMFDQITIVDLRSQQRVHSIPEVLENSSGMVMCGDELVTSSHGLKVSSWHLLTASRTSVRGIPNGHQIMPGYGAYKLCSLPNCKMALYSCAEGTVRVWDMATGAYLYDITALNKKTIRSVAALPDGRLVVAVNHILYVYDDGEFCFKRRVPTKKTVTHLRVGGKWFASSGRDHMIHVWDAENLTLQFAIPNVTTHEGQPNSFAILPEGKLAAIVENRHVCMYDLHNGGQLLQTLTRPHITPTRQLAYGVMAIVPLQRGQLLTHHADGEVCTWS